jgi:hypothetical protein
MVLCLFLISVGVLELILRHDAKKQRDSTPEGQSALSTQFSTEMTGPAAPPVTSDLLSLMRAVEGESYGVESNPQHAVTEGVLERKPGKGGPERGEETASMIEYNRGDAN